MIKLQLTLFQKVVTSTLNRNDRLMGYKCYFKTNDILMVIKFEVGLNFITLFLNYSRLCNVRKLFHQFLIRLTL